MGKKGQISHQHRVETNEFSKKQIFKIVKQSSGDEEKSRCSRAFAMQGCRPELNYQQLLNNSSVLCALVSPPLTKMETKGLRHRHTPKTPPKFLESKCSAELCFMTAFSRCRINSQILLKFSDFVKRIQRRKAFFRNKLHFKLLLEHEIRENKHVIQILHRIVLFFQPHEMGTQ